MAPHLHGTIFFNGVCGKQFCFFGMMMVVVVMMRMINKQSALIDVRPMNLNGSNDSNGKLRKKKFVAQILLYKVKYILCCRKPIESN